MNCVSVPPWAVAVLEMPVAMLENDAAITAGLVAMARSLEPQMSRSSVTSPVVVTAGTTPLAGMVASMPMSRRSSSAVRKALAPGVVADAAEEADVEGGEQVGLLRQHRLEPQAQPLPQIGALELGRVRGRERGAVERYDGELVEQRGRGVDADAHPPADERCPGIDEDQQLDGRIHALGCLALRLDRDGTSCPEPQADLHGARHRVRRRGAPESERRRIHHEVVEGQRRDGRGTPGEAALSVRWI